MLSWTTWREATEVGHRLISANVCCRLCGRIAGDLIGYADRSLAEARFMLLPNGYMPAEDAGDLRCGRCGGRLYLDEVEVLGRHVPLEEIGGVPFARAVRGDLGSSDARYSLKQYTAVEVSSDRAECSCSPTPR